MPPLIDVLAHAGASNLKHAFGDIVFNFTAFDVVFNGDKRGRVTAQIVSRWSLTTCSSDSMPEYKGSEDLKSGKGMAHSVVIVCWYRQRRGSLFTVV